MATRNPIIVCLIGAATGLLFMLGVATFAGASVDAGPPIAETHLDGNGPQVAPAVDAPVIPDADADPVAAGSFLWKLWKAGHLVPAILVGLFMALAVASRRIDWLTEGRRAVYTAAALAGLAVLAEPASRGTTPSLGVFLTAAGAIAALLLAPTPKVKAA